MCESFVDEIFISFLTPYHYHFLPFPSLPFPSFHLPFPPSPTLSSPSLSSQLSSPSSAFYTPVAMYSRVGVSPPPSSWPSSTSSKD